MFVNSKIKTNLKKKCTSVRGIELWNNLDDDLIGMLNNLLIWWNA